MNQTQTTQPTAQRQPAPQVPMVTRNGQLVPALTLERVGNIIKGMEPLGRKDAGQLYENFKVTGDGNFMDSYVSASGKIVPASWIYNINRVSEIGMSSPAAIEAYTKGVAAEQAGDSELAHDAFRDFLNKATISFNARTQAFSKDQLVQGVLTLITTERGQLLKLENVSAMRAKSAPKAQGFSLANFMSSVIGSAAPSAQAAPTAESTTIANAFANGGVE